MFKFIQTIINTLINRSENQPYEYAPIPINPQELSDDFYDESGNIPSVPDDFEAYAEKYSRKYMIPKSLISAIAMVESSFRSNATRYEPAFQKRYVNNNPEYSDLPESEKRFLSTSFGYMQVMGLTAIETLGASFSSPTEIFDPDINVELGVLYLRKLYNKYRDFNDVIASYNAGSPRRKEDGNYSNQPYVDKVTRYWNLYKTEPVKE